MENNSIREPRSGTIETLNSILTSCRNQLGRMFPPDSISLFDILRVADSRLFGANRHACHCCAFLVNLVMFSSRSTVEKKSTQQTELFAQPHPATPSCTQPRRQGEVGLGRARPGKVGRGWATCMFSGREHAVCLRRKPKTSYANVKVLVFGDELCKQRNFIFSGRPQKSMKVWFL